MERYEEQVVKQTNEKCRNQNGGFENGRNMANMRNGSSEVIEPQLLGRQNDNIVSLDPSGHKEFSVHHEYVVCMYNSYLTILQCYISILFRKWS